MAEDLMTTLDGHAEAMSSRLRAAGADAARRRISRRRRSRALIATLIVLPVGGLGIWAASAGWRAPEVEPAHSIEIQLDEPLEPQLLEAIRDGDAATVRDLMQLGADPNFSDDSSVDAELPGTLPYRAMLGCHVDVLEVLDDFAVPRVTLWPPDQDLAVRAAMLFCDPSVIFDALEGSPMRDQPERVVAMAIDEAEPYVINALITAGYPTEIDGRWSALAQAAQAERTDRVEIIELLLGLGADPVAQVEGEPIVEWLSGRASEAVIEPIAAAAEGRTS